MNEQTLVAVFDTEAHAEAAMRDLTAANVPADAIRHHAKAAVTSTNTAAIAPREPGFWSSLFGTQDSSHANDRTMFDRSVDDGSTVVTVRVADDQAERVSAILEKHNPVDLDERAAKYGSTETTTTRTAPVAGDHVAPSVAPNHAAPRTAAADGGSMQLAEERLSVGKRAVAGGTTRIRRYVVETPVSEQVNLRSEKVTMDRRPVTDGRPVGNADFSDKTIEMTETSEEAVVSKTAHVTEEVSLRKDATDRTETVKDTVRRDEVKVEHVPGGQADRRDAKV